MSGSTIRRLSRSSSRLVAKPHKYWPDWAANAIESDKPPCRRLDRPVRHRWPNGKKAHFTTTIAGGLEGTTSTVGHSPSLWLSPQRSAVPERYATKLKESRIQAGECPAISTARPAPL